MTPVSRGTAAGRAYLDLKAKAKVEARLTGELIQLFVLEGFLARLAVSRHASQLVLKGGVLLAAYGTRRPTRDIDFAARDLNDGAEHVLDVIREIAALTPEKQDGLVFDHSGATADVIRDDDQYSGVRVSMSVDLATARARFHIDINGGDPVWPAPDHMEVPRLLGGEPLELVGYPLHMVHAEKIMTAIQRGTVNTRWRDFADVWSLSGQHPVDGGLLQIAVEEVAEYRKAEVPPLREILDGYPSIAQDRWATWRRKQKLAHLPENFGELLEDFYTFAEPVIAGDATGLSWSPSARVWR